MDLHALAVRLSKNAMMAHYFGTSFSAQQWHSILETWTHDQVETFALILAEMDEMEMDVHKKASRRHEVNETRLKQRFEALRTELLHHNASL